MQEGGYSRGPFHDGLSVILGGCEESESSQTQISIGCGTEYEEQTSQNGFEEHGGRKWRVTSKDDESSNASQE